MKITLKGSRWAGSGAVLLAGAGLGGCSGEVPSARGDQPSNLTEIASVPAAGADVTFYSVSVEGKTFVGMREKGSAFARSSPVAKLVSQRLTTQEIYLALASEGAETPEALVAAQADEAAVLGRCAEVQRVTIDKSALVEKSLTACENQLFSDIAPPAGYRWSPGPSGTFTGYSDEGLGATTFWVLLGGCNESTPPVDIRGTAQASWLYFVPIAWWSATMGAYEYYNWYWRFYHTQNCGLQFQCTYGAAYDQQAGPPGGSGLFDNVTANAVYAGPPAQ